MIVRPTHSTARSEAISVAPTASSATKIPSPTIIACHSRAGTATPSRIAGSASTGSAASVATRTIDATPMPRPASDPGTPAWTSIRYCSAPAAAAPPGTTRPSAPDARFDVTTGHQLRAPTARRCSSHIAPQLPTWAAIIPTNQYGSMFTTRGHASSTPSTAGATP